MKNMTRFVVVFTMSLLFACGNNTPNKASDIDLPVVTTDGETLTGDVSADDDAADDLLSEVDLFGGDDGSTPDDDILLTCDEDLTGDPEPVSFDNGSLDCMMDNGRDKVTELEGSHCGRAVVTCGWRGNVYPFCELTSVSWGQLLTGEPAYSRVELYRSNMQGGWPLWGVWQRDGDLEEIFTGENEACQIVHDIYVVGYHLVFMP